MGKVATITVRLNSEKIVDKKIMDFFEENPLIMKSKIIKEALSHEIDALSETNNNQSEVANNSNISKKSLTTSSESKERLTDGFNAFSKKDF
ncbi:dihydrodipicolinate reductase [Lactobacillus sp. ESL0681]|uniref:dihydrodipicolinate reductase n=1 Tax=Lactobacillus sp. ESL0681 TaxID=2983211 RepID=UPI0023F637B3|nr:dihydrodipicolinate reductase [Lactobacillus sp. ESL0681]WEV41291.1 dihydrodipicolinate reductase [Lactobacillus sp. ESL0681]